MKWIKRPVSDSYELFVKNGYSRVIATTLAMSGITTLEDAKIFLHSKELHDTSLIRNINEAIALMEKYIDNQERICIFGDYDVDGTTATAIAFTALQTFGANVVYRLPDRINEGYGISKKAIIEQLAEGTKLFITVDNGIRAIDEIKYARENGAQVIVLDHHQPGEIIPDADVTIDLYIEGETYPFIDLTGSALAWKVFSHLLQKYGFDEVADSLIDLAAIGTIADVASLVGENRAIVKRAIDYMRSPIYNRKGIIKLFQGDMSTITAENISFLIAPRINAAGRLLENGADIPTALFLEEDGVKAEQMAQELSRINTERKLIQSKCYKELKPVIEEQVSLGNKVLVLFAKDAPSGVVGLLAGNATEEYHRPTIVFSEKNNIDGTKIWTGSARSIEQFHMLSALEECADCLERFGGHALAAGMSIKPEESALLELRKRLNANCTLTDEDVEPCAYWDIEISEEDVGDALVNDLRNLEPFGEGCRRPTFKINLKVLPNGSKLYDTIGETEEHLKLYCKGFTAVGFWMVSQYVDDNQPRIIEAIGYVDKKIFKGNTYFQFVMDDYHPYIKEDSDIVLDLKDMLFNL